MENSSYFRTGRTNKADQPYSQFTIENDKKEKGFTHFKKGQQVSGTVVSVGEQVTLNFSGQYITSPKNILGEVKPGDTKIFEVVKASDKEIILKLLDQETGSSGKAFQAGMMKDTDREALLTKKERAAQRDKKEAQYRDINGKLEEIGKKLTSLDAKALEEEGFSVESFTVDGLSHALNRTKKNNAESQSGNMAAASESGQAIIKGAYDEKSIALRLKQENLPATTENINKLMNALGLSSAFSRMDDNAMKYLILKQEAPSVENIYKASYSGAGISTQKLSDETWSELKDQAGDVIKTAGFEANQSNLESARWLVENNLPLTVDSFTYRKELEELAASPNQEAILGRMLNGMKLGTDPLQVSLLPDKETAGEKIINDVASIQPEAVAEAVRTGTELTIKNLAAIQQGLTVNPDGQEATATSNRSKAQPLSDTAEKTEQETAAAQTPDTATQTAKDVQDTDNGAEPAGNSAVKEAPVKDSYYGTQGSEAEADDGSYRYEEVKARRQLEEIRLKMTLEAAAQLEKKGFSVETESLSRVVDELKRLEDSYYKQYFREADTQATEASLQTLKETTQSIEKLKYMPSYLLGSTLEEQKLQTIPGLLAEGSRQQAELQRAGTAYETLMTVPNSEYGDSIKKAFANSDSLLSEMKLDNSESNQRAVRILGYNRMEINEESINRVKAFDLQVTTLIKNLHPAVTVRMIKEGRNPLQMPIGELNRTIDRLKEEQGITSEEKFSNYLVKLEKQDNIAGEERKAYIGIYRLLYNVEKSDGAALGAVIKSGMDVTLGNLLTAVQTDKKGRIDAAINDEFGTLQEISREKESIASQLRTFSDNTGQQSSDYPPEENKAAQMTEYLDRLLKQMKEELTPDRLKETGTQLPQHSNGTLPDTTAALPSREGIWETVRDVPLEKLFQALKNTQSNQMAESELHAQKVQEIRDLCRTSEQSIRFLNDYQVPSTPHNIMLANQILSNGESPIKKLLKLQNENNVAKSEKSLKDLKDLSDTINDKHSMEEVYTQLETDAKSALERSYSEERIDSRKLAELKSIAQQMTFMKTLAQREYYQIPVETKQGVTNINLTILRGTQTAGKVSISVRSEQLGNIKAELSVKDKRLQGFISSDSRNGLERLKSNSGEIEAAALENSLSLKQLDFLLQRKETDTYIYQNPQLGEENTVQRKAETEKALYRLAKAVVRTVVSAENSGYGMEPAYEG